MYALDICICERDGRHPSTPLCRGNNVNGLDASKVSFSS